MRNKLFIGAMLMALILVFASMVSAEDLYHFTLSEGAAISEDNDSCYLNGGMLHRRGHPVLQRKL